MPKSISITLPHDLGVPEAKRRVQVQIERARTEYLNKFGQSQVSWAGDQAKLDMTALGQAASATIDVFPQTVRIEVALPWILAALSSKVEGLLKSNGTDALRLADTSKK